MSNAPDPNVPDSALTREQLYARLRNSSKQAVVLEEMQRLGFWPREEAQPTVEAELIRRESELQATLNQLSDELRGVENRQQALKTLHKERMAAARARREETKQKQARQRFERARAWHARRQQELLYLGDGVSAGLGQVEGKEDALQHHALPSLQTASELAKAMGLSLAELRFLAWHREVARVSHYQRFTMPKKSGGLRQISAPMPRLKRAQYWVLDNILAKVAVHEAAHGFRAGRSILSNAAPHVGRDVVINLDLKDFFPSIGWRRVRGVFRQLGYGEQIATVLAMLCTEAPTDEVEIDGQRYFVARGERVLPQGAPTSPMLTNVLCRRLDTRLAGCAAKLGFRYTRYADDLSFSADATHGRDSAKLLWRVHRIIASEGFTPHPDKQQLMRQHRRQQVTGLVVNRKLSLDRDTLRRFRAVLHQAETQVDTRGLQGLHWQGNPDVLNALAGYANFIAMVDAARGQPLVQRVKALRARVQASPATASLVNEHGTAAKPSRLSNLAKGSFRSRAAAGDAPWPDWWQPAVAAAPILEKTAEQIATEKAAAKAAEAAEKRRQQEQEAQQQREAAQAEAARQTPASAPVAPVAAPPPSRPAASNEALWINLFAQFMLLLLLRSLGGPLVFFAGLGMLVYNAVRREARWGRFLLVLAVAAVLSIALAVTFARH